MLKNRVYQIALLSLAFVFLLHGPSVGEESVKDLSVNEFNKRFLNPSVYDPKPPQGNPPNGKSPENYYGSFDKPLDVIIGNEDINYEVVPGDSLTISFHDRNEVTKAIYQVSGRGEIFFPLVGPIEVAGLNRGELRGRVNEKLKKYIRNPNVEIEINVNGRVMIVGSVHNPGIFNVTPRYTVMEAIIQARYDKGAAKLKNIVVMRGPPDQPLVRTLDLQKMIKQGDRSDNIFLKPGDLVYVPNSLIKNLDNFLGGIYDKILMWYGIGGNQITD